MGSKQMGQVITRRKKRHKRRIASLTGGTNLPPIRTNRNSSTAGRAQRHHTVPLGGLPHLGTLHPRVGRPSTASPKLPSIQLFNERVSGLSARLPPSKGARQPSAEHIEPIRHSLSSDTSYSDDSFEDDEDFDLNQQSQQLFEQQQLEQQRLEQEHQRLEQEKQRELEQQRLEQLEQAKQTQQQAKQTQQAQSRHKRN